MPAVLLHGNTGGARNHYAPQQRQPHRTGPAPPSTISTSSSTSSNATVRPQATTPRAQSPNSRHMSLPPLAEGPLVMSSLPGAQRVGLNRHPHWDKPVQIARSISVLNEEAVLSGLRWRLEQYLDIQPPYGLLVPEMVEAARADMNVCGPALDMLMSAIFADGDPPVCELPLVQTDASGAQTANYTVPLTSKNCPEALKSLFTKWDSLVPRLKQLDERFRPEVARIICDMEPLENPLLPQVMQIAADLRIMASEISLRRTFLSNFHERLLQALQESEGATIPRFPRTRLNSVDEGSEPPSSSSSRSSSRNSHRQRPRTQSLSSAQRGKAALLADPAGGGAIRRPPPGLRSRSSTQSLRIGKDGEPLLDSELAGDGNEGAATGSDPNIYLNTGMPHPSPRQRQRHLGQHNIANGNAAPHSRPSSRTGRDGSDKYEYVSIQPLTIPAFSDNETDKTSASNSHASSRLAQSNRLDLLLQTHSAPVSPSSTDMLVLPPFKVEDMQPSPSSSYGARPLPKPTAPPATLGLDVNSSRRGPRPLPPRPSRSPNPDVSTLPSQIVVPSQPMPGVESVPFNIGFVVPDQGGFIPTQQPPHNQPVPQPFAGFVVASSTDISDVVEVPSSTSYDLQVARERYAMESTSSLPYLEEKRPDSSKKKRHGQQNLDAYYGGMQDSSFTPPVRPSTTEPASLRNGRSNDYSHHGGQWTRDPSPASSQAISSQVHYRDGGAPVSRNGASDWTAPNDWNEPPPPPPPKDKDEKSRGVFSNVKFFRSRNADGKAASQSQPQHTQRAPSPSSRPSNGGYDHGQSLELSRSHSSLAIQDGAVENYYRGANSSPTSAPSYHQSLAASASLDSRYPAHAINGHGHSTGRPSNEYPVEKQGVLSRPIVSPGFAEVYQNNPNAASRYYGAGPSSSRAPSDYQPGRAGPDTHGIRPLIPSASVPDSLTPEMVAIRETMYGAIADALSTPAMRQVTAKDEHRAYFSAVSLAIFNVGTTLQPAGSESLNIIKVMGRDIRLSDLPGAYRTVMTELASIGREAKKLSEEDDERAIAYVARGKDLPEPRIGRVKRLLERGVGYVGADGRVRGGSNSASNGGTGRSREFSNKINALCLEMMKLPAFQEDMLRILVP